MIVERDEILATINECITEAERGTGSLVLVGGEAGSGKTSVVRETVARCGNSVAVVQGACDPLTTARPLGPVLEIAAHPDLGLGGLIGDARTPADVAAELTDALASHPGAVLVVVEDLHWADDGTLDTMRYLARRVDRTRAVVLATYRTDEVVDDHRLVPVLGHLRRLTPTRHVETRPLSLEAVRDLVRQAEVELDPVLVHRRTGGNAFFVTEVLASGQSGSDVPGNVAAAVMARVAALDAGTRRLVEAVAISPRALEYEYAVALTSVDDGEIDETAVDERAVDEATSSGVLSVVGATFEFRHELARLAVEQSTPDGRRRRMCRALVDRLVADPRAADDVARIAHHAIELGDGDLILRYGLQAADMATDRGSNREAAQFLAHVVRVAESPGSGVGEDALNGWRVRLGSLHRLVGDHSAAALVLERAAADYRRRSDHAGLSAALRSLSAVAREVGERSRAEVLADDAVVAAEASGDQLLLAQALAQSAAISMLARRARSAAELAERGLALAVDQGHDATVVDAEHMLACANLLAGSEDQAIDTLTRLERRASEIGDTARQVSIAVNIGTGCGEVRRYQQAEPWLVEAEALAVGVDMDQAAAYCAAWLARVAFETGRWDDVAGHVQRATNGPWSQPDSGADPVPDPSIGGITARGALGRTRVRRGDPGGREALVEAIEVGADHDVQYLWPVACGLAEDARWRGDTGAGLAWLAPIHDRALQTESTWARGETSYWMWRLGGFAGPPPDLVARPFGLAMTGRWSEAADAWEKLGCPYEQALSLVDSGLPQPISRALTILDSLGARPAAQWARQRLRDLGSVPVPPMPRPATIANPASLTNRQREVLELIVAGASNHEIAERLFVSKKTVEHHVSAVYTKLGVSDRPSAMVTGRELLGGV